MNRRTVWLFCIPALLAIAIGPVTAPRLGDSLRSRVFVAVIPPGEAASPPAASYADPSPVNGGWRWDNAPRGAQRDNHMGYDPGMLRASLVGTKWEDAPEGSTPLDSLHRGPIRQRAESFDASQVVVVVFNSGTTSSETKTFDGQAWTLHRVPGPPPRTVPATYYDPARKMVVLFTAGYVGTSLAHGADVKYVVGDR